MGPAPADQSSLAASCHRRHTHRVRRAGLLLLLVASLADARPRHRPPAPKPSPDLWQRALDPNGAVATKLLAKARDAMSRPERGMEGEWAVDQRLAFFRDAYNILREARRLSPQNTEVLAMLGQAADELGNTREALDALEAAVAIDGPDKASNEVTGRLGAIELRLGHTDAAIRWLRYAQTTTTAMSSVEPLIYLASALSQRGEIIAATEVLDRAMPAQLQYYNPEAALVAFSLAVLYDRDEQRSNAFNTLDRMQGNLNSMYTTQLQQQLSKFEFVPAEDQHYYLGLFYESLGEYTEARASWLTYAASGESPWRRRALDHVEAIDAQRRANPTIKPTQIKPPK